MQITFEDTYMYSQWRQTISLWICIFIEAKFRETWTHTGEKLYYDVGSFAFFMDIRYALSYTYSQNIAAKFVNLPFQRSQFWPVVFTDTGEKPYSHEVCPFALS